MPAERIVLVVEYDGTDYYGFQFQAGQPTIQDELEKAWRKLTGESRRVVGASRTDTGVHARGQVVSLRTESRLPRGVFVSGLNHYLPGDIAVREAHRVRDSFHVQRHALSREYRYHIWNSTTRSVFWQRFSCRVSAELNIEAMNEAASALVGEHDFASFAGGLDPGVRTRRTVHRVEVERERELVVFNMVASSFLTHQVRNTVGALIRVGRGKITAGDFGMMLEAKSPGTAGPSASACGLCLMKINYPRPFEEEV